MKSNRFWIGILGGIVLLCLAALLVLRLLQKPGDQVQISQGGVLLMTLPLAEDTTQTIPTAHGGYNTVVIQDGAVSVTEASCPDQVCVRHAPLTKTGVQIVCLPNQLVVDVISRHTDPLDGVTG